MGGADLPGETGSSLTIDPVTVADAGSYEVVVTNVCSGETSVAVALTVIVPTPGDLDLDCDVDLIDYVIQASCMAGPGVTIPPIDCTAEEFAAADTDADGDVDLDDFAGFQEVFSGM